MELTQANIDRSTKLVTDVYRGFRDELLDSYGEVDFSLKSDNSPVTELDMKVETALRERLAREFPDFGFYGEETEAGYSDDTPYWVVDPIDGTQSFIRGIPKCTNMAALVVNKRVISSVVYDFVNDNLFTAQLGKGAYRNNDKITVKEREPNMSAVYSDNFDLRADIKQSLRSQGVSIYRPLGASGNSFILLAQGKIDGYLMFDTPARPIDTAAGILIAKEAGAELVSEEGVLEDWTIESASFSVTTVAVARILKSYFGKN
jgi:myo-inositol-1(or 4)-monophosphatase